MGNSSTVSLTVELFPIYAFELFPIYAIRTIYAFPAQGFTVLQIFKRVLRILGQLKRVGIFLEISSCIFRFIKYSLHVLHKTFGRFSSN